MGGSSGGPRGADSRNGPHDAPAGETGGSVRRQLAIQWSRRDWLAVGVIALTVAFLVGTTLTVLTAGAAIEDQTSAFDADATVRVVGGPPGAVRTPSGTVELPLATGTVDGRPVTLVGVPADAPRRVPSGSLPWATATLPAPPPPERVRGPVNTTRTVTLPTGGTGRSVTVSPEANRTILPPWWYVANASTVRAVGANATLLVQPGGDGDGGVPAEGAALIGAVAYLLAGSRQLTGVLSLVTAGSGLLVGIVCYSVTRMSVRDRRRAVFVARATGAAPRAVVGLFTVRAASVTLVGIAAGYALGTIVVNVGLNVAVALGVPTTLAPQVTPAVAGVLGSSLAVLAAVGTLAGGVAAWRGTGGPPASLLTGGASSGRLDALLGTAVLRGRAAIPAALSLAVFVTVALVAVALALALGPLTAPGAGAVVEPSAHHPLASEVDAATAVGLRAEGVAASPELLVPTVSDGVPYLVRGARWGPFANVSDATLVAGRPPDGPREALVGADLAGTLDVGIGDRLTLGGGTAPGVARVRVVGVYRAPGYLDDQLLVGLGVGTHLSNLPPGRVHFVRTDGFEPASDAEPGGDASNVSVAVTDVSIPGRASPNASVTVTATVRYFGTGPARHTITARLGDRRTAETVRLRPGTNAVRIAIPTGRPGQYELRVAGLTRTVRVVDPRAPSFAGVPERAPPNATLRLRVTAPGGAGLGGATVTLGNRSATTRDDGRVRLRSPATPGEYALVARSEAGRVSRPLVVDAGARRRPVVALRVRPGEVTVGSAPEARVDVVNPWARPLNATLALTDGDRTAAERSVSVAPGGHRTITAGLPRAGATGERSVVARVGGVTARTTYRVEGDERLVSALARSGYRGTAPVGQGLDQIFGNLQLLVVLVVVLAGVMVTGATAAVFGRAVHARRQSIGVRRATGATPLGVYRTLLGDAVRIGGVAVLGAFGLGLAAMVALDRAGLLVLFGVRVAPVPSPGTALAVLAAGLGLVVVSTSIAVAGLVRASPATLLSGEAGRTGDAPAGAGLHTAPGRVRGPPDDGTAPGRAEGGDSASGGSDGE